MSRLITNAIRSTSASSDAMTIDSSGKPAFPNGGVGKILQVKQLVKSDVVSVSGNDATTFVDITGFNLSITPSSSSHKVLITYNLKLGNQAAERNCSIRILRDSSTLTVGSGGSAANGTDFFRMSSNGEIYNASHMFLDSPSSSSSLNYKLQWALEGQGGGSRTAYLNRRGADSSYVMVSTLTLMEVAA